MDTLGDERQMKKKQKKGKDEVGMNSATARVYRYQLAQGENKRRGKPRDRSCINDFSYGIIM